MKRRKRHKGKIRKLLYGITAVALVFLCLLTYSFLHSPSQTNINQGFSYKAAIVDHLSLFEPNPTFNQTASTILEEAGFTVDYYPAEKVTVESYRNLPSHDYGLIILRVHSAIDPKTTALALFTSELYNKNDHYFEQLAGQVGGAQISQGDHIYFGVGPLFVLQCVKGSFHNTIIIMMSCNGLTYTQMAEAFIKKGAKAYISWSDSVLASHTDKATIHLLQHLITEKQTIKKAVSETMEEVGPDPESGSILQYYPDSVDYYIIPNSASKLILNEATISVYHSIFRVLMFIVPSRKIIGYPKQIY